MSSRTAPDIIELDNAQLEALVLRLEAGELAVEDIQTLVPALKSYAYVTQLIDQKSTTIARLRKLLFGAETEKTAAVTGHVAESPSPVSPEASGGPSSGSTEARQKSKGHGRNGAEDFPGAKRVSVPHEALSAGDPCPSCARGTLYGQPQSGIVLRFTGQPPVQVTIYELEKLRCGLCGEVFTAKPPEAAGLEKYDPSVASMVALLKYGNGLPFNRLDGLQENLGMPLPSSTQWEIVAEASSLIQPAYDELIRQAAQGNVLHNDDTTVKILELMGERAKAAVIDAADPVGPDRSGCSRPGWSRRAKESRSRCSSAADSMPARIFGMSCSAGRPTSRLRSRCAMPCPAIDHRNSRRFCPTAWHMRGGSSWMSTSTSRPSAGMSWSHFRSSTTTTRWHARNIRLPRNGCSSIRNTAARRWSGCESGSSGRVNRSWWSQTPGWAKRSTIFANTG